VAALDAVLRAGALLAFVGAVVLLVFGPRRGQPKAIAGPSTSVT